MYGGKLNVFLCTFCTQQRQDNSTTGEPGTMAMKTKRDFQDCGFQTERLLVGCLFVHNDHNQRGSDVNS